MEIIVKEHKQNNNITLEVVLNRPSALNSLSLNMFQEFLNILKKIKSDKNIALLIIHSENEKAFCAGGDVKEVVLKSREDATYSEKYFSNEYLVDYLISKLEIPTISVCHGVTMGGGLGLINGCEYKVFCSNTIAAMPEVSIGFFPDVGATEFLVKKHRKLGTFIGMTGARLNADDLLYLGLADHKILFTDKQRLIGQLTSLIFNSKKECRKQIKECIELYSLNMRLEKSNVHMFKTLIEERVSDKFEPTYKSLLSYKNADWMGDSIKNLKEGSLISAAIAYKQLFKTSVNSKKEALSIEWSIAVNVAKLETDFFEGVDKLLISKTKDSNWKYQEAEELPEELVTNIFSNMKNNKFDYLITEQEYV